MTDEQQTRSLEAERLLNDDTLRTAIASMRMEALERLATLDATATDEIREAQSIVRVADGLVLTLQQFVAAGRTPTKRAVA